MKNKKTRSAITLITAFLILVSFTVFFDQEFAPEKTKDLEGCTAVIITGTASEDGKAILTKNRDASESENKPLYTARNGDDYSFVTVNWAWMGMNEKGLALMNTVVSELRFGGTGLDNGNLNRAILATYATVDEVCTALNSTSSPIGPPKRLGGTCVGVIDRFGKGAFIEISGQYAFARFIENGFDSQANHARHPNWNNIQPGLASGPSGRDQYALDIVNTIISEEGTISYQNVMQKVTRYIHNKEQGTSTFSVSGEMANPNTVSSMVAVSGDTRYEGKINCFWATYGNNPINGLYIPSIPWAGTLQSITQTIYQTVEQKKTSCGGDTNNWDPIKVREIQSYAFPAEEYTINKYEEMLSTISTGMSDSSLKQELASYIDDAVAYATDHYINSIIPSPTPTSSPQIPEYTSPIIPLAIITTITLATLVSKKHLRKQD